MSDDTTDPFEQFKKEREKKEKEKDQAQNEEKPEEDDRHDKKPSSASDDPNLIDSLKKYTNREGRPSGFWSHTFDTDEIASHDIQEISEERPGGFSSHRLAPEEQEELNEEARDSAEPPEGFESHRMDQELESDQNEDTDNESEKNDRDQT